MLVASDTNASVASSLTCRLVYRRLEAEVEVIKSTMEGELGHTGPGGHVTFSSRCNLDTQKVCEHLGVRQLLPGCVVQPAVQHLHGL